MTVRRCAYGTSSLIVREKEKLVGDDGAAQERSKLVAF